MRARVGMDAAVLALLALSAFLSNTVLFRQTVLGNTDLTRTIPARLGAWEMIDEAGATPSEVRGLETRDVIKRTYSDGRSQVELVVAYIAHSSRKSAHAQEACLRGAGALVGSIHTERLAKSPVEAKVLSIDLRGRRDWVYYWYKIGDVHSAEYLMSSLRMFLRGLVGSQGGGGTTLIRLLTPEGGGEAPSHITERIEDFTSHLVPELQKTLP